jgi:perosamine synthetase
MVELEVCYAMEVATHSWGPHFYDFIQRFEVRFAEYTGLRQVLAVSNAVGARHLELGPGEVVVLADTNWIASVAPLVHLGAPPVFVDILPDSWCQDPDRVGEATTPKAIITVHLYDMDRLEAIAAQHKFFLIEDAVEALGLRWGHRLIPGHLGFPTRLDHESRVGCHGQQFLDAYGRFSGTLCRHQGGFTGRRQTERD